MIWRKFSVFMEAALYGPRGYYRRPRSPFGRAGDFFTNAHVSPLYGELWASFALAEVPCPGDEPFCLVELGCGDGRFAEACCRRLLRERPDSLILYGGVDLSDGARRSVARRLGRLTHEAGGRLRFVTAGSPGELIAREPLLRGAFTFCNEVLDALPCDRIRVSCEGGLELLWVGSPDEMDAGEEGPVCRMTEWRRADVLAEPAAARYAERYVRPSACASESPVVAELPVGLRTFLTQLDDAVTPRVLALVDYGGHAADLCGPDRPNGSLRAYREHKLVDPFDLEPGECDITYDVNFDAVMDILRELGFRDLRIDRQGAFLVYLPGFAQVAEERLRKDSKAAFAIQQFVMPGAMGDRFQVCVARK